MEKPRSMIENDLPGPAAAPLHAEVLNAIITHPLAAWTRVPSAPHFFHTTTDAGRQVLLKKQFPPDETTAIVARLCVGRYVLLVDGEEIACCEHTGEEWRLGGATPVYWLYTLVESHLLRHEVSGQ